MLTKKPVMEQASVHGSIMNAPSQKNNTYQILAISLLLVGIGLSSCLIFWKMNGAPDWFSDFFPSFKKTPSEQTFTTPQEKNPARTARSSVNRSSTPTPYTSQQTALSPSSTPSTGTVDQATASRKKESPSHFSDATPQGTPAPVKQNAPTPSQVPVTVSTGTVPAQATSAESLPVTINGTQPFSAATPVTPQGNIVQGKTTQTPPAQSEEAPALTSQGQQQLPEKQDSIVSVAFVNDLAAFLAQNYWPEGTHPLAKNQGISTVGLKWMNYRYGGQLQGLAQNAASPPQQRQKILQYALMPSMVNGLYGLYKAPFLSSLEYEALTLARGDDKRPLTNAEVAEMYTLYASQMQDIAGAVQAYTATPEAPQLVTEYARAEAEVDAAHTMYMNAVGTPKADHAKQYQLTVMRREQARENIATAMRRSGTTRTLNTESLVFIASWLHRRDISTLEAQKALATILADCAVALDAESHRYQAFPPQSFANGATSAPR